MYVKKKCFWTFAPMFYINLLICWHYACVVNVIEMTYLCTQYEYKLWCDYSGHVWQHLKIFHAYERIKECINCCFLYVCILENALEHKWNTRSGYLKMIFLLHMPRVFSQKVEKFKLKIICQKTKKLEKIKHKSH